MSKTNDTSNLATLEDRDTLADTELHAVTGGIDRIKGESNEGGHTDWVFVGDYDPYPVGVWQGLLHQYGY